MIHRASNHGRLSKLYTLHMRTHQSAYDLPCMYQQRREYPSAVFLHKSRSISPIFAKFQESVIGSDYFKVPYHRKDFEYKVQQCAISSQFLHLAGQSE